MNQIFLFYEIATLPSVARNDNIFFFALRLLFNPNLVQNDYIIF